MQNYEMLSKMHKKMINDKKTPKWKKCAEKIQGEKKCDKLHMIGNCTQTRKR